MCLLGRCPIGKTESVQGGSFPPSLKGVSCNTASLGKDTGEAHGQLWFPHLSPAVIETVCDRGGGMLHFPGVLMELWAGKCGKISGFTPH